MKSVFKNIDRKWKEYALAGCICILFFVCITNLGAIWSAVMSFFRFFSAVFIGFVIAYILNPLAKSFDRGLFRKIRRDKLRWALSVSLSILILLVVIALLIILLAPQIVKSIRSLAENYSTYVLHLKNFILNIRGPLISPDMVNDWFGNLSPEGGVLGKVGDFVQDNANVILQKTTSIGSAALNGMIGLIFAVYFLLAKTNIFKAFARLFSLLLPKRRYDRFGTIMSKFNTIFSRYIVFELLDAFIVCAANYIFMLIFRMPDAMLISVVVGVTNLAPTFGPIVGAAIGAFILLLLEPAVVIPFLIFTLILQTIDGYILKPRLFGDALNVPSVLILMSIIVFGKLMGVPGMLISIPVAAIIVYIYNERFIPWLERRKIVKEAEEKGILISDSAFEKKAAAGERPEDKSGGEHK